MERLGPSRRVIAALVAMVAVLAGPPSAHGASQAQRHENRGTHAHHRVAVLRAHSQAVPDNPSRETPPPAPPSRPHRATLPNLKHGSHRALSLRGGAWFPATLERVVPILAAHDRSAETHSIPSLWLDPIRSGRGPPRAGPYEGLVVLALAGLPPASSRRRSPRVERRTLLRTLPNRPALGADARAPPTSGFDPLT